MRTAVSNWLYNLGPGRYYQPAYTQLAQSMAHAQGRFLDLGCGPGWLGVRMAEQDPELEVVGIDLSDRMLGYAREHGAGAPNARFVRMDAAQMSFPESHFSMVATVQSVHHWRDTAQILSEAHRVLSPGGSLVILEADRHGTVVPRDWVSQRYGWPPERVVRLGWRRFGMDDQEWSDLLAVAQQSAFERTSSDRIGFYRRLVLHR